MIRVNLIHQCAAAATHVQIAVFGAVVAQAEILDGASIRVIDGDTVALPCAAPAPGCSERLRFYAIDSPEVSAPRCEGKLVFALQAKEMMRALLQRPIIVVRGEPGTGRTVDPYGRTLGTLARVEDDKGAPRGDVQRVMLQRGLALRYAPGARAKEARRAFWCGERPKSTGR